MERVSDRAFKIINELHTERLDYESEYLPLIDCAIKCAAYEDTGLEPEEISKIREDVENGYLKSTARRYGVSVDRLCELAEADLDDRCVILKHTTVSDLRQQFTTLSSVCYGDDTETYTTGYRNGHRNGRIELLQYILGISDGACEAAEVALKAREQNE